jgi:hypothetical protein
MAKVLRTHKPLWAATALAILVSGVLVGAEPSYVRVPLGNGERGVEGLNVPVGPGVIVSAVRTDGPTPGEKVLRLSFQKTGPERRIVPLEAAPSGSLEGMKALLLRCRLEMREGETPRLAVVCFERDGGAWYRLSDKVPPADRLGDLRLPLERTFARALFAGDADESLRWDQVERVWVGLVVDGAASGTLEVSRAVFTNEPFKATVPLSVWGNWDAAQDPAVRAEITTPDEGPGGTRCMKYAFEFPGGLLVMLMEADGTQYLADPAPPAAGDWTTLTIPFDRFRRGGWSHDENDRLDLNDVAHVAVGLHGTATPAKAPGTIRVAKVELVP